MNDFLKAAGIASGFIVGVPVAIRIWQITAARDMGAPPPPVDNSNPISRLADGLARWVTGESDGSLGTIVFDFFNTGEEVQQVPSAQREAQSDQIFVFDTGSDGRATFEDLFLPPTSDPFNEPQSPEEAFFTGG